MSRARRWSVNKTLAVTILCGIGHVLSSVVVGLVGVSQDLRLPDMTTADYEQVATAVRYAEKNISAAPTVRMLADAASMSPYCLDRRMQRVFGLTTGQWMLKLRLDIASEQLIESDLPIATVAQNVGYSDQSAFTRQFSRATGLSPSKLRIARSDNRNHLSIN